MAKHIVITGGASGIGRAVAGLFIDKGWAVAIVDRDLAAASELAAALGRGATPIGVDVLDAPALAAAIGNYCGEGGLDALFNSAGLLDMRCWLDTPLERQYQIFDVNVKGVLNAIHAAVPHLRKTPGAQIVTMSSAAAIYGVPEEAVYSASKFAVRGLTEALNVEFDPLDIWVSDLMVGFVNTPMVNGAGHKSKCVEILGVNVEPRDVAQTVWRAVHERQVHWFVAQGDADYFDEINRISPEARREMIKAVTGF
ncbi:MAG: SDR family oxidoreductase [Alphaproteobacteria bacterium]|nr:SDR family oxidoreductase [Alphaproteobacteria bacterium]